MMSFSPVLSSLFIGSGRNQTAWGFAGKLISAGSPGIPCILLQLYTAQVACLGLLHMNSITYADDRVPRLFTITASVIPMILYPDFLSASLHVCCPYLSPSTVWTYIF